MKTKFPMAAFLVAGLILAACAPTPTPAPKAAPTRPRPPQVWLTETRIGAPLVAGSSGRTKAERTAGTTVTGLAG